MVSSQTTVLVWAVRHHGWWPHLVGCKSWQLLMKFVLKHWPFENNDETNGLKPQ